MALSKEEIAIRVGVDSRAVKGGLDKVSKQFASFAKGVGVQLVAAFSFGAVISQIKSTINYVEQLSNTAGSLNVSASFLQDITNIGVAAGKSQTKVEKLLTLFAKGLLPGQDLETEFMKFLDEIAATKDPAERLAKAFDRVGKSGKDLLEIAKDGSKAFTELAATFQKMSDEDIAAINKLDATLDSFWNRFQINIGRAIASTQSFIDALKRAADGQAPKPKWLSPKDAKDAFEKNKADKAKSDQDKINAFGVPGIIEGPVNIDDNPRYGGRMFSYAQPRGGAKATGQEAVDNYMSKIKSGQAAYKSKTDYSEWGKAMKTAQLEAAKEVVQKVSIVEIKE